MSPIAKKPDFAFHSKTVEKPFFERVVNFLEMESDPDSIYGILLNIAPYMAIVIAVMVMIVVFV